MKQPIKLHPLPKGFTGVKCTPIEGKCCSCHLESGLIIEQSARNVLMHCTRCGFTKPAPKIYLPTNP